MFSGLMTDKITVKTSDGEIFTDVAASVQGDKIFTDRTDIPVHRGDQISRRTPAGVEENFIIEDPGFRSGGGDLPDTYQMRVRAAPEPLLPPVPLPPRQARIEKTVFISYRRIAVSWAHLIFQELTQHGYDVFFDFHGIASGAFEEVILENIKARAHFLVLLTPSTLGRCIDPADLFRREIEAAIALQRNIVPIMLEGFNFGVTEVGSQPGDTLAALKRYNGLHVYAEYFQEAMQRLRDKYLNVPLSTVLHPASRSAAQAAKDEQAAAATAPVATERELREVARERYVFTVKIRYQDELERPEGTRAEEPYGPGSLTIYDGESVVARYSSVERWSRQQPKAERDALRKELEGTLISSDERDRRQFVMDKLRNADRDEIDLLVYLTRSQSVSVSTIHERGWNVAVNELMRKELVPEPTQGGLFYQINEKLADAVKHYLETRGSL
jgi:hypothetical protein